MAKINKREGLQRLAAPPAKPAAPFVPGDLVTLKSGSAPMTVEDVWPDQDRGIYRVHILHYEFSSLKCRTIDARALQRSDTAAADMPF